MSVVTVTAEGQVALREELLRHLGISPGDKVVVELRPQGRVEMRAEGRPDISSIFGRLQQNDGVHLSIEEMSAIIADGWAGER